MLYFITGNGCLNNGGFIADTIFIQAFEPAQTTQDNIGYDPIKARGQGDFNVVLFKVAKQF